MGDWVVKTVGQRGFVAEVIEIKAAGAAAQKIGDALLVQRLAVHAGLDPPRAALVPDYCVSAE